MNDWRTLNDEVRRSRKYRNDEIAQACISGETVREMATHFGVSRERIDQILKDRQRRGEHLPPPRQPDPRRRRERDAWIAAQVEAGVPVATVASEVGLKETVAKSIVRHWKRGERRRVDEERQRVFLNVAPLTREEVARMPRRLKMSLAAVGDAAVRMSEGANREIPMGDASHPIEPIALSIEGIMRATGLGRTFIYEAIRTGELKTFKAGRRRLATRQAVVDWVDGLAEKGSDST